MILVLDDEQGPPVTFDGARAITLWRVLRAALWAEGVQRDPRQGDVVQGHRIVALTL